MGLAHFSAIGRPLDVKYLTNKLIMAVSFAALVITAVLEISAGSGALQIIFRSLGAFVSVFFAWSVTRELDPDEDWSAFLSVLFMTGYLIYYGFPNLMIPFWFLMAARILNRTAGSPAKIVDSLIVLLLGTWLSFAYSFIFAAATTVIFLLDQFMKPGHKFNGIFALLEGSLLILTIVWFGLRFDPGITNILYLAATIIISLGFIIFTFIDRNIASSDDRGGNLNNSRFMALRLLILLTILSYTYSGGINTVHSTSLFWLVFAAIPLFRVKRIFR